MPYLSFSHSDLVKFHNAAKLYKDNLLNRTLTFYYIDADKELDKLTVVFKKENFAHLVGLKRAKNLTPTQIFSKCLNNNLSENEKLLCEHRRKLTTYKLDVYKIAMNIDKFADKIGEYDLEESVVKVKADYVVGHNITSMTFYDIGTRYIPTSVLKIEAEKEIGNKDLNRIVCVTAKRENLVEVTKIDKNIEPKIAQQLLKSISKSTTKRGQIIENDNFNMLESISSQNIEEHKVSKPPSRNHDMKSPSDVFANAKKKAGEVNKDKKINKNLCKNRNI